MADGSGAVSIDELLAAAKTERAERFIAASRAQAFSLDEDEAREMDARYESSFGKANAAYDAAKAAGREPLLDGACMAAVEEVIASAKALGCKQEVEE